MKKSTKKVTFNWIEYLILQSLYQKCISWKCAIPLSPSQFAKTIFFRVWNLKQPWPSNALEYRKSNFKQNSLKYTDGNRTSDGASFANEAILKSFITQKRLRNSCSRNLIKVETSYTRPMSSKVVLRLRRRSSPHHLCLNNWAECNVNFDLKKKNFHLTDA